MQGPLNLDHFGVRRPARAKLIEIGIGPTTNIKTLRPSSSLPFPSFLFIYLFRFTLHHVQN